MKVNPALFESNKVQVKFEDVHRISLRDEGIVDLNRTAFQSKRSRDLLSELNEALWVPVHTLDRKTLERFRKLGSTKKRGLPDLANYFTLCLPNGRQDAFDLRQRLDELQEVEHAELIYKPVPPPVPPDFTVSSPGAPSQGYLGASTSNGGPNGIDAFFAWTVQGGDGAGVSICDIEYDWHLSHAEFSENQGLRILGNDPLNPLGPDTRHHGTCVVGVYGSRDDGTGTTGIAFNVGKFGASVFAQNLVPWLNIAGAITTAMDALNTGDIIVIEQHLPGPTHDVFGPAQNGFVPVEWDPACYDAIVTAVSNGFLVVEAAGNGAQNLDDNIYSSEGHKPFLTANNSGAIMVGAGHSSNRSRLDFSNYGARVDVQGWGHNVVTTASEIAEADAWSSDGSDNLYTRSFNGTSSATPIVAGACASLQGIHFARFGRPAAAAEILTLLRETDSTQGGSTAKHIGPLPDLRKAIELLDRSFPDPPIISPASGILPAPAVITINVPPQNSAGVDDKTWYTTDGTEPTEDNATATEVPWPGYLEVTLNQERTYSISAKTFFTADLNGERVGSPSARAMVQVYTPTPGPTSLIASNGTFADKVIVTWDALINAVYYEISAGPAKVKINEFPIVGRTYEDLRFPGTGAGIDYWVRGVLDNGRISAFAGPARGSYGLNSLIVTASKGVYPPHVLVGWTYPAWDPASWDIEFEVYRADSANYAQATLLTRVLPKTRVVVVGNHVSSVPDGIDTSFKDTSAQSGASYYYWVIAKEPAKNYETPPGQPDVGFVA